MADVRLKNVSKRFGDVAAVKSVDLDIADKEFLVLVGPSGCGKTTTLRMVAGLEDATSGEIYIGDRLVNDVEPKDRDIAMVFQNYALYPHMNVYENMAFGLKLRKFAKAEIDRRVKEAAEILDIGHLLKRRPKELSGGQRQRVALGRAIVRDPAVFLMDEPLSNLDAKLRVQMRTEISKLHQRVETTVIYVTHDQVEAMTMGHRIVVMKDGLVQQVASPQELYDHPRNLFVAGFIGSPAMNFLHGQAAIEEGAPVVRGPGFEVRLPENRVAPVQTARGRDVVLGVRPEDLHVEQSYATKFPNASIQAKVEVVEPLGSELYVYVDVSGTMVTARLAPTHSVHVGETLTLHVAADRAHLFDGETEEALF